MTLPVHRRRSVDMDDAKARWDRGDTAREIAKALGVSYNSVTGWARRHDWIKRGTMGRRDRNGVLRDTLAEHVANGASIDEAVERMGVTPVFGATLWRQICAGLGAQAV